AFGHQGRDFPVEIRTPAEVLRLPLPYDFQVFDVGRVDLVEGRVLGGAGIATIESPLSVARAVLSSGAKGDHDNRQHKSFHRFISIRISFNEASSRSSSFCPAGNSFTLSIYATRSAYCRVLRFPGSSEGMVLRSTSYRPPTVLPFHFCRN